MQLAIDFYKRCSSRKGIWKTVRLRWIIDHHSASPIPGMLCHQISSWLLSWIDFWEVILLKIIVIPTLNLSEIKVSAIASCSFCDVSSLELWPSKSQMKVRESEEEKGRPSFPPCHDLLHWWLQLLHKWGKSLENVLGCQKRVCYLIRVGCPSGS